MRCALGPQSGHAESARWWFVWMNSRRCAAERGFFGNRFALTQLTIRVTPFGIRSSSSPLYTINSIVANTILIVFLVPSPEWKEWWVEDRCGAANRHAGKLSISIVIGEFASVYTLYTRFHSCYSSLFSDGRHFMKMCLLCLALLFNHPNTTFTQFLKFLVSWDTEKRHSAEK